MNRAVLDLIMMLLPVQCDGSCRLRWRLASVWEGGGSRWDSGYHLKSNIFKRMVTVSKPGDGVCF